MSETPKPDSFEKRIRFGCGFLFGLASGVAMSLFLIFQLLSKELISLGSIKVIAVGVILGTAFLFGLLAMRQGDRFWHKAIDWVSAFLCGF
jgi:H+/Cl- antiporter ClcA